jgi:serine/threonine protein kinase
LALDQGYSFGRLLMTDPTLALEKRSRTRVALKEYYPADFSDRDADMSVRPKSDRHRTTFAWGLSSFLDEAQTLARFKHPTIVRVTRVFEALSTAYMVMDFEKGGPFQVWLEALGRPPTQHELDRIASPILDALEVMHAEKSLHRDIAPDNIIIREDGTPVLIDFGAARRSRCREKSGADGYH